MSSTQLVACRADLVRPRTARRAPSVIARSSPPSTLVKRTWVVDTPLYPYYSCRYPTYLGSTTQWLLYSEMRFTRPSLDGGNRYYSAIWGSLAGQEVEHRIESRAHRTDRNRAASPAHIRPERCRPGDSLAAREPRATGPRFRQQSRLSTTARDVPGQKLT